MSSQVPMLLLHSITLLSGAMDVASPQSSSGNTPRYRKSRAHGQALKLTMLSKGMYVQVWPGGYPMSDSHPIC